MSDSVGDTVVFSTKEHPGALVAQLLIVCLLSSVGLSTAQPRTCLLGRSSRLLNSSFVTWDAVTCSPVELSTRLTCSLLSQSNAKLTHLSTVGSREATIPVFLSCREHHS